MASTFAFVTTANNERYRAIAANLILSSRQWGEYKWYLVADRPLNIGERFIAMPRDEQAQWNSKSESKYLLKFLSVHRAIENGDETYVIHVDSDCVFFGPPPVQRLILQDRQAFAFLEGNMQSPENANRDWFWTGQERIRWLTKMPRRHPDVFYNLNGGFFGIRRNYLCEFDLHTFRAIAAAVQADLRPASWRSEEPYLSYAIHQMNADLDGLLLDRNLDIFLYTGCCPEKPTSFENWGTGKLMPCPKDLGIVHIFQKHDLLADDGRRKMASLGKAICP